MTRLRIGMFGAASDKVSRKKKTLAYKTGQAIAANGHLLIYGAGSTGCMGSCARGYLSKNPALKPLASTTEFIETIEKPLPGANTMVCKSLADREELYYVSDILLMLPGGAGTMREFWSFITEKRLQQWEGEIWVVDEGWICDLLKKQLRELEIQHCAKNITRDVRFIKYDDMVDELEERGHKDFEGTAEDLGLY